MSVEHDGYCANCGTWKPLPADSDTCWYCDWITQFLHTEESMLACHLENMDIDHAIEAAWEYVAQHPDLPPIPTFKRFLTVHGYNVTTLEKGAR